MAGGVTRPEVRALAALCLLCGGIICEDFGTSGGAVDAGDVVLLLPSVTLCFVLFQ